MNLKNSFFSRKPLIFIVLGVFLSYGLIWGGALIENRMENNRIRLAIKVEKDRLNNLSPEEKSILKAQNYLMDSVTVIATSERIFLSYLQRKFNLPSKLGADETPIDLHEDPRTYPEDIHYLARIAYPNRIVKEPPRHPLEDGIEVSNIYSGNCDHIPLPAIFWPMVEQNIADGGYLMTHVALALALMKDNGCSLPPNADSITSRVMQDLVKLADNPDTVADLRYEAVAFLLLSERRDLVKQSWIDQIISEQRDDGGWSREVGSKKVDNHSVLLAFWSLLEYARPDTPNEPLIRRPVNP